jgi:16S rRNA (cytosine967-C5)-methyltransferase
MPKKPNSALNSRAAAAKICWQIIDQGRSLDSAMSDYVSKHQPDPKDKGFVQEVVYGICRWYGELEQVTKKYLHSPIRKKDRIVHFILLVGFYQLRHLHTADHAAVAETVQACKQLNKVWAKKLVNGCLRNHQRSPAEVPNPINLSHGEWLQDQIIESWPNHSLAIMHANNQRPSMCLRVNKIHHTRDQYLRRLIDADIPAIADPNSLDGIILEQATSISRLPNFDTGSCSVQDTAAQLAARILDVKPKQSVLDSCAAPGGKTAHLLEQMENQGMMHALDVSERRCEQLSDTLSRLSLNASIFCADATDEPTWPVPEQGYDRILIDAPCSGLGVIRRHPDIKHHRRASDIVKLNEIQRELIANLWVHLKPGGAMLYMTCSILPSENESQIKCFLANHDDAVVSPINHPSALSLEHGVQTLQGVHSMDGFYYALLKKRA